MGKPTLSRLEARIAVEAALSDVRAQVIAMQPTTRTIDCGKCGREMTVSIRTVLAYCPACSAGLGVKK